MFLYRPALSRSSSHSSNLLRPHPRSLPVNLPTTSGLFQALSSLYRSSGRSSDLFNQKNLLISTAFSLFNLTVQNYSLLWHHQFATFFSSLMSQVTYWQVFYPPCSCTSELSTQTTSAAFDASITRHCYRCFSFTCSPLISPTLNSKRFSLNNPFLLSLLHQTLVGSLVPWPS